jgi:hypothetical protein
MGKPFMVKILDWPTGVVRGHDFLPHVQFQIILSEMSYNYTMYIQCVIMLKISMWTSRYDSSEDLVHSHPEILNWIILMILPKIGCPFHTTLNCYETSENK